MTMPAAVVAVAFGLLMGWGLGGPTYPRLPVLTALVSGAAVGVVFLATSFGSAPGLAAWSLILGCAAALATASLRPRK